MRNSNSKTLKYVALTFAILALSSVISGVYAQIGPPPPPPPPAGIPIDGGLGLLLAGLGAYGAKKWFDKKN